MAKLSLIALAKEMPRESRQSWLSEMAPDNLAEMNDLIKQWRAGVAKDKLPFSKDLARILKKQYKLSVTLQTITRHIRGDDGETR